MPNGLGLAVDAPHLPNPTIARLGTARTAFVGRTLRGPVAEPLFVASFAEFQHRFGGLWQPSPLGYAVEQFFDNGGREAIIVRVCNGARSATLTLKSRTQALMLKALRPGTREFLRASVDYDNIPATLTTEFNLTIQRVRVPGGAQVEDQEIFPRLSIAPASERHVAYVLKSSRLIELIGPVPAERPRPTLDPSTGLSTGYVTSNVDGDDGAPLSDYDVIGSEIERTGLFALEQVDYFNFLCIPPLSRDRDIGASTRLVASRYCRARRALLVVDPPAEWYTAEDALRAIRGYDCASENAVMYFPRILAYDKLRGHFESFAPCGAVAGLLARSDESNPVWAGGRMDEAVLRPGYRPSCLISEDKRTRLAIHGINTLQSVRSAVRIGVPPRTLAAGSAAAADWQQLPARRLALYIVNCVERGTRWVVQHQPHPHVAELVAARVRVFFEGLYAAGAFGTRPAKDSFFVICDQRVNVPHLDRPREFRLLLGFAAARRGEFHSYRIAHSPAGSSVQCVSLNMLHVRDASPAELVWIDSLASRLQP